MSHASAITIRSEVLEPATLPATGRPRFRLAFTARVAFAVSVRAGAPATHQGQRTMEGGRKSGVRHHFVAAERLAALALVLRMMRK